MTGFRWKVAAGVLAALVLPLATAAPASAGGAGPVHVSAGVGPLHVGVLPDGTTWQAQVPSNWNGTLLLFSHGYGETAPEDSPDPATGQDLLDAGYALAGSSYDPTGSLWALDSAVSDQYQTLAAVEKTVLATRPRQVIAVGQSMGGLVSELEDEDSNGRIDGALTTCGLVAGGQNLENYQLDGTYVISRLIAPALHVQLAGYTTPAQAVLAATELQKAAETAQHSAQGRARLALASAFLNVPTWTATNLLSVNTDPLVPAASGPAPAGDYAQQEAEQYDTEYATGSIVLPFIESGRASVEQAAGGQPAWDAGVNFASVLAASPYRAEVEALYKAAGLSLGTDLAALSAGATVKAQPAAVRSLRATSVPTGKLQVPELDIHTIADQLIPVQQENYYRQRVRAAGAGALLKQAYVDRQGHCNFTSAEIIAALDALRHRLSTGTWGNAATASSLQAAATALNEGGGAYVPFSPPPLTGANG